MGYLELRQSSCSGISGAGVATSGVACGARTFSSLVPCSPACMPACLLACLLARWLGDLPKEILDSSAFVLITTSGLFVSSRRGPFYPVSLPRGRDPLGCRGCAAASCTRVSRFFFLFFVLSLAQPGTEVQSVTAWDRFRCRKVSIRDYAKWTRTAESCLTSFS